MRDKLPVMLENLDLPNDILDEERNRRTNSSGFVNIVFFSFVILALIVSVVSIMIVIFLKNR